jgi:hypothetical protein
MSFLTVGVLVAVARLVFPGVDLRRNVPVTAAVIVASLVIERIVNGYMTGRAKR